MDIGIDRWWCLALYFGVLLLVSFPISFGMAQLGALGDSALERDAAAGDRAAARLLSHARDRVRTFGTLRTGLALATASEFLLIAAAFSSLPGRLGAALPFAARHLLLTKILCTLVLLFIFGGLHLLFGMFLPEALGRRAAASKKPYRGGWIVGAAGALFRPFYAVFRAAARGILSLFGLREDEGAPVTEEAILDLMDRGEESGGIERGEHEMIEKVFEFTDRTVGEVMTHRTEVEAIDLAMTDEEVLALISESGYSRFPVYEEDIDRVRGVLAARTFLLDRMSGKRTPLSALIYPPYFVPESKHADDLLQEMKKDKLHMALVSDEYGGTLGIVTMEDLLEEIVGNIYDETDDPAGEEELVPLGEGVYRAAGSTPLDRLEEALGVDLAEEECETLGGLVFSRMTLIPEDGATPVVDAGNLHIEVEELRDRRVVRAKVSLRREESEGEEEK